MNEELEVGDVVILSETLTTQWSTLFFLKEVKLLVVGFLPAPPHTYSAIVCLLRLDGTPASTRRGLYQFYITSLVKVS